MFQLGCTTHTSLWGLEIIHRPWVLLNARMYTVKISLSHTLPWGRLKQPCRNISTISSCMQLISWEHIFIVYTMLGFDYLHWLPVHYAYNACNHFSGLKTSFSVVWCVDWWLMLNDALQQGKSHGFMTKMIPLVPCNMLLHSDSVSDSSSSISKHLTALLH